MQSIWLEEFQTNYPKLIGDIKRDTVIIGGGIAGILTAYQLRKRGIHACILEADRILHGVTGHTTAKITALHGTVYHNLEKKYSTEFAQRYYNAVVAGIDEYEKIIFQQRIDCGFSRQHSVVYTLDDPRALEKEAETLTRLGADCQLAKSLPLPLNVKLALEMPERQFQFHPVKFLSALLPGLEIFEHTRVLSADLAAGTLVTDGGNVSARRIVFACHFPFVCVPGYYFARMYQSRSYTAAILGADFPGGMYVDNDPEGLSFRGADGFLLVGGFDHRTGKKSASGYSRLSSAVKRLYPGCRIAYHWSAQDCMTYDSVPYAGLFSNDTPNVFIITGFNKWGMSDSMACSILLGDLMAAIPNPAEKVFSPKRHVCRKFMGSFLRNAAKSGGGLLKQTLRLPLRSIRSVKRGKGAIVLHRGKKCAAYRDDANVLYLIPSRCPHMGCELNWNQEELSWDCPCHGSRFDIHGHILDSPASEENKR